MLIIKIKIFVCLYTDHGKRKPGGCSSWSVGGGVGGEGFWCVGGCWFFIGFYDLLLNGTIDINGSFKSHHISESEWYDAYKHTQNNKKTCFNQNRNLTYGSSNLHNFNFCW
jgi:hypothetical protein